MKISRLLLPLFVTLVIITGCSKSDDSGNADQASADSSQMEGSENSAGSSSDAEAEHFLSGQQRALEKAKGVESMLQETEEKRRKAVE